MLAGHFFLAFLITSSISFVIWSDKERALYLGILAGCFAFLPDLDTLYAFTKLPELLITESNVIISFRKSFGSIHRSITHSPITGIITTFLFAVSYGKRYYTIFAIMLLGFLGLLFEGIVGGGVMIIYGCAGGFLSLHVWKSLSRLEFSTAALLGLLSHPLGDMFTGIPPELLYPFTIGLINSKIIIVNETAHNVLLLLLIELLIVLTGIIVMIYFKDVDISGKIFAYTLTGILYIPALIIAQPAVGTTHRFILSLLGFSTMTSVVNYKFSERIQKPSKTS